MQVFVNCFAPSGLATNGLFTVLFYKPSGGSTTDGAYVWADNPTATNYTPNAAYQWTSKLLSNTVAHTGTGLYQASLAGLTTATGTVLVTGYGPGSERCKVVNWNIASSAVAVNVACFRGDGSPVDTQFTLSYMTDVLIGGAFAWADQPYTQSYTPAPRYERSSTGSTITVIRDAIGSYNVTIPSQPPYNKTAAFVTSYGTTPNYCNVGNWLASGTSKYNTVISVKCYDRYGSPADDRYAVQYVTDQPPYLFATTSLNCGGQIVTVSTGNGDGWCTKNTNNGKDDSVTCNDGKGNWTTGSCSGSSGSCGNSAGSGSCTISK